MTITDLTPTALRFALIIVDPLNDFTDPNGSLYVNGAEVTFEQLNRMTRWAEANGIPVIFVRDRHPATTPHFASNDPDSPWPDHCVDGTWGADIHPAVYVPADAIMIYKGTGDGDSYSGFGERLPDGTTEDTGLDALLRRLDVNAIIVVGYATDWCDKATALDGRNHGYVVYLIADAVAAVNLEPDAGRLAIGEMVDAGVRVAFTDDFVTAQAA